MTINDTVASVESSSTFKEWEHADDAKVAHLFAQYEASGATDWQVGYLHDDKITTFGVNDNGEVIRNAASEVFKHPDSPPVQPLDVDSVTLSIDEAVTKAKEHQQSDYPTDVSQKIICILQQLDGVPTWNLTMVTITFKTLNIRVNARNGSIISSNIVSFFEMRQ